ncbi:hypothetical protein RHSIM_Rhsim03G0220300 [Rhododendron simsii]|uniref:Uncharacterized protein n=1 Tax=Rhododendron simsii TaxID=118357 RepID=A0A834LR75_RHOSS|nr:hypothetical protein RHSIM_Rhsim03G0220300 [Rhododendron simsii]
MEKKARVICSAVGFLGLLSAVLGFAAEAKRETASDACKYDGSTPAWGLGLAAALTLMVAQIIISITGCFCCRRHSYLSNSNRRLAIICFVISW